MKARATVVTRANIALAKYWGKRDVARNIPAVPSLSVTLAGMQTHTSIEVDSTLLSDSFELGGRPAPEAALARTVTLLDRVRQLAGSTTRARVVSSNDFPTASGLASSASGFAALALCAAKAYRVDASIELVSDLARRSSASAARSLFGGFVELGIEPDERGVLGARQVAPADHLDVKVLVCVTSEGPKSVASTDGMMRTSAKSPYFAPWVAEAPRMFADLRAALLARDLERVGELTEASALAMHASAIAAGVIYFTGATLSVLERVRSLRASGLSTYATMDAGPHVKVLVSAADADRAKEELAAVSGVLRVIETSPGAGPEVVEAP